MDLRQLRHFIAVAEEGHFGRAAARLGIEQSPLSRSIRQLEAQFRCPLLDRSARGSRVTAAGAALLPEAKAILALAGRFKDRARALGEGRDQSFTIAVCDALATPRLSEYLTTLRRQRPALALDFQSVDGDQAVVAVEQGRVDAAFVLDRGDTGTVCRTPAWAERLEVVVAARHDLACVDRVPLGTLLSTEELLVGQAWATTAESWLCDVAGEKPYPSLRVLPTIPGLVSAVALDVGPALMPSGVAASFAREDVTVRRIAGRPPRLPAVMLSRRDATHPAIAVLRELARERSRTPVSPLGADRGAPAETPGRSP